MVAFCGIICTDCPAYLATQSNDREALERVLAHWRKEFNAPHIAIEDIVCDGCLTVDGRLNGYCRQCQIRPCGVERGVPNCAYCDEYVCDKLERLLAICDQMEGFFDFARPARATLDSLRADHRKQ